MERIGTDIHVVIVEFYTWHDECLYTTCQLLKQSGAKVSLALNKELKARVEKVFNGLVEEIHYFPFRQGLKGVVSLFSLHRLIRRKGYTHVYLNTASGSEAWKFCLIPISRLTKVIGTMHNIAKLTNSFGQRIITRRLDGYVLLSDILMKRFHQACTKPVVSIYPIIYPQVKIAKLVKPENELWITIPGAVSLKRRDYFSLLPPQVGYALHIKFIILGNKNKADGRQIYDAVCRAGVRDSFVFFDSFVPEDVFYAYVLQSDYIMPLVHPGRGEYDKYLTEKISGTYNLAIAYRKPMLCPVEMQDYEDFRDSSLFYSVENLQNFINLLSPQNFDCFYQHPKWTQEVQQKRLAEYLGMLCK